MKFKSFISYIFENVSGLLWDLWCVISIVGIWPRFVEPNLLKATRLKLALPGLPADLQGFKIVQFTDLHLHPGVPDFFLKKILKKIIHFKPDLIVFTGDFLCFSQMNDAKRLKELLCALSAPYGCFAILGNHDYAQFVSINEKGEYDILSGEPSTLKRGFKRLITDTKIVKRITPQVLEIGDNAELIDLIQETPFKLLKNETIQLKVKGSILNLCGLEEYILGRCKPGMAFKGYDPQYPGIVLAHNPDSVPLLLDFPGDVILSGHTHGGQVNLPWIRKKLALMENMDLIGGLKQKKGKWIYVNRGVGCIMRFRWFALPEILCLTLESK